jgi:hypothetical protein
MYKIAITGQANSGKDTLSKMLVKQLRKDKGKYISAGYIAFADPIKEMARCMFPNMPRKYFFGSSQYRKTIIPGAFKNGVPLTIRQVLLDLGTEVGRSYKDDIWLDNFDTTYKSRSCKYKRILVVTDVRFRNEFDHLKNKGFQQIRLYRNTGEPGINHISETDQNSIPDSDYDFVIHNDETLNQLKQLIINDIVPRLKDI